MATTSLSLRHSQRIHKPPGHRWSSVRRPSTLKLSNVASLLECQQRWTDHRRGRSVEESVPWLAPVPPVRCTPVFSSEIRKNQLSLHSSSRKMVHRPLSIFVSKHASFSLSSKDVLDYCSHVGISISDARTSPSHVILRECPFCPKPTYNKADNLYKIYIKTGGGAYFCHRCGASGSWLDFKSKLGKNSYESTSLHSFADHVSSTDSLTGDSGKRRTASVRSIASAGGSQETAQYRRETDHTDQNRANGHVQCLPMPPRRLQAIYSNNLLTEDAQDPKSALHYLTNERGISLQTLRKYGVGKGSYKFANDTGQFQSHDCVTFSWIMSEDDVKEQEALRGAVYVRDPSPAAPLSTSSTVSEHPEVTVNDNKLPTSTPKQSPFVTRRIKVRALASKIYQRLDPPGGGWGFFGYHTVPKDAREVIVTEGEYDAMAVWQATGRPSISLPNGCRSLPVSALPLLERFERIYLWMDNDTPGQEGAEIFAKKLGLNRCYHIRPTPQNCLGSEQLPKDANDALRMGLDLNRIIKSAKLTPHDRILSFDDLRHDVLHEILHPDQYVGVPLPSLPSFTKIVQGLRRGELWVITGPTGCGKTTVLTQLSLDLAEQGVNVLWGSFEIKNTRLIHKMMQQLSREPLGSGETANPVRLSALADRFGQLPLHFLKFHGGTDVDDVLDAMEYAVYVNDCQHIILDNMQFMISRQSSNHSWDKFDIQDVAIEKFRKFATDRNVHITIVMHPRKQQDRDRLDIASIYGSAKATQEADLVLILQKEGDNRKFLDVRKNRFNGELGTSPLFFDRSSGRYFEEPIINVRPPSFTSSTNQQQPMASSPSRPFSSSTQYKDSGKHSSWDDAAASATSTEHTEPAFATVKARTLPTLLSPKNQSSVPVPKGSLMERISINKSTD